MSLCKKHFSNTKMLLWQMLYDSPFSTHFQVPQPKDFAFHVEMGSYFFIDPGFSSNKSKETEPTRCKTEGG